MARLSNASQTPTAVDVAPLRSGQLKTPNPGTIEKAPPHSHSEIEYQNTLGLSEEVQDVLRESHAYVYEKDEHGYLLIKSLKGDPRNPRSWPNWKRYGVVGLASLLNNLVSRDCSLRLDCLIWPLICLQRCVYACRGIVQVRSSWGKSLDLVQRCRRSG